MKSNIDDQCGQFFKELKFQRKYRYLTFKVDKEQVVEKVGQRQQDWSSFLAGLPPKEPRMCIFDLEFTNGDGMNISKVFFCYWLPDGTPLKIKLLYATFKQNFKTHMDVGGKEIILNTADEFTLQELIKQFP